MNFEPMYNNGDWLPIIKNAKRAGLTPGFEIRGKQYGHSEYQFDRDEIPVVGFNLTIKKSLVEMSGRHHGTSFRKYMPILIGNKSEKDRLRAYLEARSH